MKNKQQLLQEQKQLRTKLAQVTKQINLQEVARMQQIAGVKPKRFLKENFEEGGENENKLEILKRVCEEMNVDFNEFYEDGGINTVEGWFPFDEFENETFEDEIKEIIRDSNDEVERSY